MVEGTPCYRLFGQGGLRCDLLKRWPLSPFSSALTWHRLAVLRSGTSIALQSVNLAGFTTLLKPPQLVAMK